VFIPKYRRKVMYGKVRGDIREIIKILCRYKKVEIVEGAVCLDHVHICVSIPPKIAISEFMGYLKGKSALMIFDKHPELGNKFERDFWARGYYVSNIGNVDEATIKNYIKEQEEESYNENRSLK
jgi:putative transposase